MTLRMSATVTDRGALGGVSGRGLDLRLHGFVTGVRQAQKDAALRATTTSRAAVKRTRPPGGTRRNRYTGLKDAIAWQATRSGGVQLDAKQLNAKFPPWLVQEIGTGQKAIQHVGGKPNPTGRPTKGAEYVKTVKSQIGRRITPGLVWGGNGKFQAPDRGRFRQDQIIPRALVTGAPVRFDRATRRSQPGIVISREIEGQHFIKKGGEAGYRDYRQSVLAAARSQLKKRRTA